MIEDLSKVDLCRANVENLMGSLDFKHFCLDSSSACEQGSASEDAIKHDERTQRFTDIAHVRQQVDKEPIPSQRKFMMLQESSPRL